MDTKSGLSWRCRGSNEEFKLLKDTCSDVNEQLKPVDINPRLTEEYLGTCASLVAM